MSEDLTRFSIPQLESFLMKWINEAVEGGNAWAAAKAYYESLEDKKKPMLAKEMDKFQGSNNAKEAKALTTVDYDNFLITLADGRTRFYKAQVAYDMAKLKIDALRTIISARKAEVQNFRG